MLISYARIGSGIFNMELVDDSRNPMKCEQNVCQNYF